MAQSVELSPCAMAISRQGDWLSAKIGEEVVMMSAATGLCIGLSAVGARVWELLETPSTLDALCMRLADEYEVAADQARADVAAFLKVLAQHDAVAFDPEADR